MHLLQSDGPKDKTVESYSERITRKCRAIHGAYRIQELSKYVGTVALTFDEEFLGGAYRRK